MKKIHFESIVQTFINRMQKSGVRFLSFLFALLAINIPGSSQPYTLLKDIYPGTGNNYAYLSININGMLYFSANDGIHGNELWKSDGTAAGTVMIKDIYPGTDPSITGFMVNVNGTLFFLANDGVYGRELWKSDGTEAGTLMVKDINPGVGSTDDFSWHGCVVVNGILYFMGNQNTTGHELWRSDGTESGTYLLKDIYPGVYTSGLAKGNPLSGAPYDFCELNGTVYFIAGDENGREIWKTDGTTAGTVMAVDIVPGYGGSGAGDMINLNGTLIFITPEQWNPQISWYDPPKLWRSDGTAAGTYILTGVPSPQPFLYTAIVNGVLLLSKGNELWKTDGTVAGTSILRPSGTSLITKVNGTAFFFEGDGVTKLELWKTDGTVGGTVMVKSLGPLPQPGFPFRTGKAGNELLFNFNDGIHGNELWTSDGTNSGTHLLQDIEPGPGGITWHWITEANGKVFLEITNSTYGHELWVANVSQNIPLPLTLLEFKGSVVNDNGLLQWKTDNEINTKSFAVERSTDGRHFSAVGNVKAANETGIHLYSYTDASIKSLGSSIIYYRLRQVDADNKSTWSRIVALTLDKQKSFVMLYPNPVRADINLTITLAKKDKINWLLTDNNGRVVKNGYYELGAGSSAVVIDGASLSAGNYLLRLNGEVLQQAIKIVKQ